MNLTIFIIGLIVAIVTGYFGYVKEQNLTEVLILIFSQATLTVCLELLVAKTRSDKTFGDLARRLAADRKLSGSVKVLSEHALRAKSLENQFLDGCLERLLRESEGALANMANGVVRINLASGGRFFRETAALEVCLKKYQGTSLVKPEEYWHGPIGRESLEKNRMLVLAGKTVERIFIEHRGTLGTLVPFVEEHMTAGVQCFVVAQEDVDTSLRRDFGIIDDGKLAVHLILDSDRDWSEARFYVEENPASRREIQELKSVWESLRRCSIDGEEFLRPYRIKR